MKRRFSVVIPVLGEAETVVSACEQVLACAAGHAPEIVVVDGDSRGSSMAGLHSDDILKLRSKPGRATQMNAGARASSAEVLVFLHADTRLPTGAFTEMQALLATGADAGFFRLGFAQTGWRLKLVAAAANIRSRIFGLGFGDQAFFVRREAFEAVGGFAVLPLFEDLDILVRLKRRGFRLALSKLSVSTSGRRFEQEGLVACVLRNWLLQAGYALGVSPELLARYYRYAFFDSQRA